MKHFIGYRADGSMASVETFSPGGWPDCDCCENCECLADPHCMLDACVSLRSSRSARNPDIVGFVPYSCPCPTTEDVCQHGCYNKFYADHYVDLQTKLAMPKPASSIQIDGADVDFEELVSRPPGQTVSLRVTAAVEDGTKVTVYTKGADVLDGPSTATLSFTGGGSETLTLYAPGQGSRTLVGISGKLIRPRHFIFRGFGS